MFNVAMAIEAQDFLIRVLFMGNFDNPHLIQVHLLSPLEVLMTAHTSLVHQVIAGREFAGNQVAGVGMTVRTGNARRMNSGGKPPLGNILILMTAHAEKGMAGGETNQAEAWNGRQDQEDRNDQSPLAPGQFGYRWDFHDQPS